MKLGAAVTAILGLGCAASWPPLEVLPVAGPADPGLSGLTRGQGETLWAVSERGGTAVHIDLSVRPPRFQQVQVGGVPLGHDLEGIAWLGGDRFALATETHGEGHAAILLARLAGGSLAVNASIELPAQTLGIPVGDNQGAEGICGQGNRLVVAVESVGTEGGRRFAPIVVFDLATRTHVTYRLFLTSDTGKVSSVECAFDRGGAIQIWVIERHFGISRLVTAHIDGKGFRDLEPTVERDLAGVAEGRNFEGLARTHDGRWALINDNFYKEVVGRSELVLLR